MPHRILHILGSAQAEGTSFARIVGALGRGLDPARYKLHACFLKGDGPLAAELEAAGVEVRVVDWTRGARDPVGTWRFWHSLRGERFAIMHQHYGGRAPRWLARRATGAKVITHLHGYILESRGLETVPVSAQGADLVIAASQAVADRVVGTRARVVYAGAYVPSNVDRNLVAPRNGNVVVLGTAGRLVPIKGVVYLVRALAALRQEIPDVRLEIAGSGPERAAVECEVQSLGLAGSVVFLGWQHDLERVLPGWDVFVQPSLTDSFGIATLEAMAAGLPVVATGVGGLRELVEDGRTGWLVPPADPAALAKRLRDLALNPAQRRAMGMAGRERARAHFSVERMVAEIQKIYDELLAGSAGCRPVP
ncbi:MAG: glycosyltransferase [Terriglobia bacterium]|jgi:glycosyltransferase involved in cell wall biosynthesis